MLNSFLSFPQVIGPGLFEQTIICTWTKAQDPQQTANVPVATELLDGSIWGAACSMIYARGMVAHKEMKVATDAHLFGEHEKRALSRLESLKTRLNSFRSCGLAVPAERRLTVLTAAKRYLQIAARLTEAKMHDWQQQSTQETLTILSAALKHYKNALTEPTSALHEKKTGQA